MISAALVYVAKWGLNEFASATEITPVERNPVKVLGGLQHVGIAVREHDELVSGLQAASASGTSGKQLSRSISPTSP